MAFFYTQTSVNSYWGKKKSLDDIDFKANETNKISNFYILTKGFFTYRFQMNQHKSDCNTRCSCFLSIWTSTLMILMYSGLVAIFQKGFECITFSNHQKKRRSNVQIQKKDWIHVINNEMLIKFCKNYFQLKRYSFKVYWNQCLVLF